MKQSGQIEIEEQNSVIKPGNIIRLMQPFRPERYSYQEYTWAVVAGVVRDNLRSRQSSARYKQIIQGQKLRLGEVIVYLYEPQSSTIYLDRYGTEALFSFYLNEVKLEKVIQKSVLQECC